MEKRDTRKKSVLDHREEAQFSIPQEPPIVSTLRQEIFELETLNRHIQHEHEALRMQNKIEKTMNDNILLHFGLWYKKNK